MVPNKLQVDNMGISEPKITLVEEQGKRHSQVEILDTRIGVLARPSARIFPPLYDDQLAVHIGADVGKRLAKLITVDQILFSIPPSMDLETLGIREYLHTYAKACNVV